jgi:uncharacterized protein (DUF433 family)
MATGLEGHITSTPGICGGKPCIAGHRIRVMDIVLLDEKGYAPEEIVLYYPQLTLAQVYAAMAYYHDHHAEIREQIRQSEAVVDTFKREHPEKVLTLHDPHADAHPLPR